MRRVGPAARRALILVLLAPLCLAADRSEVPPDQIIPGRPWTSIIPDPDRYDWNQQPLNRVGYRFRGMAPTHRRFYDYIQDKRARGIPLSYADGMMIRELIAVRRWPEPPRPNAFWRAFMRYLREQPTTDLNLAQRLMLDQLFRRGLVVLDTPMDDIQKWLAEYLGSGPFEARNWFERTFGRVEPWIQPWLTSQMAMQGYDMRLSGGGGGNIFPDEPFNGMQITYNVSGATLGAPVDSPGFTTGRSIEGILQPGTLTVSGMVRVGGFGADLTARVWAGDKEDKLEVYIDRQVSETKTYSLSVPVPRGTETGGFLIRLDGRYSMGGGHRGLFVRGSFQRSQAEREADRAAAEAKWRQEVEDTLRRLGYEDTPEGRELKEMRDALAGGEEAWKAYTRRKQRELGRDDSPPAREYYELKEAASKGGEQWQAYVDRQLNGGGDGGDGGGGLQVGTGVDGGQLSGVGRHFDRTGRVASRVDFKDLPPDTTVVAVWYRDGQEVIRSERVCGGTGWASFSMHTDSAEGLDPGRYEVVITAGGRELGRGRFTIGNPDQGSGETAKPITLGGWASSVPAPIRPAGRGGKIHLTLNYSMPGVVLDTIGLGQARAGDYKLSILPDGRLEWRVYQPDTPGARRAADGWHILRTDMRLEPNQDYEVTVAYGAGGTRIAVDRQLTAKLDEVLPLSDSAPYLGDTPADDGLNPRWNIHPSFAGSVTGLRVESG